MTPFTFIDAITYSKRDIYDSDSEKHYVPFIINRGLSYFADSVLYANDLNLLHGMPKRQQFNYLLHSVSKRRRFSKWAKKTKTPEIEAVMHVMQLNQRKAMQMLTILSDKEIKELIKLHSEMPSS